MTTTAKPAAATTALATRDLPLNGVDDLLRLADIFYKGGIAPKGCGRPEAVAAVILMGREVGLRPAQAMSSIMVVTSKNGPARMSMWGDALLALVRASGKLQKIVERLDGTGDERRAVCIVQRVGEDERTFTYSVDDAKKAKLWTKEGPWQDNPNRQLTMRARAFALRDVFTDVLCGLVPAEEAYDYAEAAPATTAEVRVLTPAPVDAPASVPPPAVNGQLPPQPADAELMVTDEQCREIAGLQERFIMFAAAVPKSNKERFAEEWRRILGKWKVDSARKLTQAQAEELLGLMRKDADTLHEELRNFF